MTAGKTKWLIALLLMLDLLLSIAIIDKIPCNCDHQVRQILHDGERDYSKVTGDSGPLVYPAGFVCIFGVLSRLCHSIRAGQYAFFGIYMVTQLMVMNIYRLAGVTSIWPYALLILSKRIHSIYMLRMFNDGVAMLIFYISLWAVMSKRPWISSLLFSGALSIKMNILLFLPAFAVVMFSFGGLSTLARSGAIVFGIQVLLGAPFLLTFPRAYLSNAFDFKREFLYKWTVNWRFIDEGVFVDKRFTMALLFLHVASLLVWFTLKVIPKLRLSKKSKLPVMAEKKPAEILEAFATCNLIGILCARSLHYQFYSWYFHTIPFLLWKSKLPGLVKPAVFVMIELAWNVFPSTSWSSLTLLLGNVSLLVSSV